MALLVFMISLGSSHMAYAQGELDFAFRFVADPIDTLLDNDETVVDFNLNLGAFNNKHGLTCRVTPDFLELGEVGSFSCATTCNYNSKWDSVEVDLFAGYNLDLKEFGRVTCGGFCEYDTRDGGGFSAGGILQYAVQVADFADLGPGTFADIIENCGFQAEASISNNVGAEFDLFLRMGGFTF